MERGGNAVVSLVVQVVLARLLAPDDFGMLAIIIVFVNIGAVFVQSGLNSALIQSPNIAKEDYSTVFWCCLAVAVVLYAFIFFTAPYIGAFYSRDDLVWPLRAIALILIINAFNAIQSAKVTRDLELKKTFYATITSVILSGVIGISVALLGMGIWALVMQQLFYQLVNCFVLGVQINWHPELCFSYKRAKELFGFGWKLLISGIINTLYQSLSSLVIGKQFSQYDLGLVSQGEKYPQAIGNMLDGAIQPVMFSAVSRVQADLDQVKGLTKRALKTSSFLVIPVMGLFALVADPFTRVFLGEQWLGAIPFLQTYCFVYALYPIQSTNLQTINGLGRSDIFLKLEIVKKIYGVAILFFAAFILKDIYAIVIGAIITSVISIFVNSFPSKRLINYGLFEQLKDMLPAIVLSVIAISAASLIGFLDLSEPVILLLQCVAVMVVYAALSAVFHLEEFSYLMSTLKDYFRK